MKNNELKKVLKTAYSFNESDSEKRFIRSYEQGRMRLWDIVKAEFGFMGWKTAVSGLILFVVLLALTAGGSENGVWCVSGILPLFGLLLSAIIGSSERYLMDELEAACRFSLSFVRMVRMLIIGVISLILIFFCTVLVRQKSCEELIKTICFISFPYLLNVSGCLFITRKLHGKEDVYACSVSTCLTCLIPAAARFKVFSSIIAADSFVYGIVFAAAIALAVTESILYIQEGDKKIWNLC